MDFRSRLEAAKTIDIVKYLSAIGHDPVKIRGNDYWYLSPLRSEKTASFKVNKNINRWYDFGLGKGGNFIDFCIAYHHFTIADFFQHLDDFGFLQIPLVTTKITTQPAPAQIRITGVHSLSSWSLIYCLKQRHIPMDIADNTSRYYFSCFIFFCFRKFRISNVC